MKSFRTTLLYHISDNDFGGEYKIFFPRVPSSVYLNNAGKPLENETIKRVCFSTSIFGALNAIHHRIYSAHSFNVYAIPCPFSCDDTKKRYSKYWKRPTKKEVYDAYDTGEIWILAPVKALLVGTIDIKVDKKSTEVFKFRPIEKNFFYVEGGRFLDYILEDFVK